MNKGYELIEASLSTFKSTRSKIEREIENLVNNGIDEDDLSQLKNAVSGLFRYNAVMKELLFYALSDEWSPSEVRESVLKQKIFLLMQRTDPEAQRNVMDLFCAEYEKFLNEASASD